MNHGNAAGAAPDEGAALAVCSRCGETKPAAEFNRDRRRTNGRSPRCRVCIAIMKWEWRERPGVRERLNTNNRAWRLAAKMEGLRHYGGVCACCGEADVRFLTFDHVDGGGNRHLIQIGNKLLDWLRRHGWPAGFQVLCFNCNSGRAINGGVCPHRDPAGRVTC